MWRKFLILWIGSVSTLSMAQEVAISYELKDFDTLADAHNVRFTSKIHLNDHIDALYIDVLQKSWPLLGSRLSDTGMTANTVAYYHLGRNDELFLSTQLQVGTSDLFPKFTAYHETSYRFGDQQNLLFGVGLGYQDYYDRSADTFYKIGPVYYFANGAIGYKYGKYHGTESEMNSLFLNYRLTDKLTTDISYDFGRGLWPEESLYLDKDVDVESSDLEVKLSYQVDQKLYPYLEFGQTKIKDSKQNLPIANSQNYGVGLKYQW